MVRNLYIALVPIATDDVILASLEQLIILYWPQMKKQKVKLCAWHFFKKT